MRGFIRGIRDFMDVAGTLMSAVFALIFGVVATFSFFAAIVCGIASPVLVAIWLIIR